jgi:uncharacterized protein YecE (DUF72 family)
MEFGRITDAKLLDAIDWTLPAEPAANDNIWPGIRCDRPAVFVGAPKWALPNWLDKVYPKGTKPGKFLDVYARNFNCIELNASYYHLPTEDQVHSWLEKTAPDFRFCPKFPEQISHTRRLYNVEADLHAYAAFVRSLGTRSGPGFLILHPQMGPETLPQILDFIHAVPADIHFFLELRHPAWFAAPELETLTLALAASGHGLALTDTPGRRDALHMRLAGPDVFIRFLGSGLHPSDYLRLDLWAQRIDQWLQQGLRSCYFFMHQHDELYVPELCQYFIRALNKQCGLSLKEPQLIVRNELFG